jgi:hypothetical protein
MNIYSPNTTESKKKVTHLIKSENGISTVSDTADVCFQKKYLSKYMYKKKSKLS